MAAALGLFLLWLFATGKYKDWAALVVEPAKKTTTTAGASNTPASSAASTKSVDPSQLIKTGSDWLGQISGTMMTGGTADSTGTSTSTDTGSTIEST